MNRSNDFGKLLTKKRELIKLSQQKLADSIGKSRSYIWDIEHGNIQPLDYKKLEILAKELQIKNKEEKYKFFDSAAKYKKEIPADIVKAFEDTPWLKNVIRNISDQKINEETINKIFK